MAKDALGGALASFALLDIFINGMDLLLALFNALVSISPSLFVASSIGSGTLVNYIPQISQAHIKWFVIVSALLYLYYIATNGWEKFTNELEKRT